VIYALLVVVSVDLEEANDATGKGVYNGLAVIDVAVEVTIFAAKKIAVAQKILTEICMAGGKVEAVNDNAQDWAEANVSLAVAVGVMERGEPAGSSVSHPAV